MKKVIYLVILLSTCMFFTGCGNKKVTNCSTKNKQTNYEINTDYKISAKNEIVSSVEIKQIITSKDKKMLKEFKKQLNNQYETNNKSYGGYKYDIKIKDKELTAIITIDYEELDMEKFVKDNVAMKDYVNKKNQFTLEGAKKLYRSTGAKCE